MEIRSAKDLIVYQKAYQLAMAVFEVSKGFPPEERCAAKPTRPWTSPAVTATSPPNSTAKLTSLSWEVGKMLGSMSSWSVGQNRCTMEP